MNAGQQDVSPPLTATGTTQATALLLINGISYVGTVASGTGVVLFPGNPGTSQRVYNAGANTLKVYPASGTQINGLGTNNPMLLATNTGCLFKCISTTRVFGILSA